MKIDSKNVDGVLVLSPKGKITIGAGDVALREAVLEAVDDDHRKLLIDLGEVKTMDSSGVGELVSAYTTVSNRGGVLKLCNLPTKIADILQVTQLITVFEVFEDQQEALASYE